MFSVIHRITARFPQLQRANLLFFDTILSSSSQRKYALRWMQSLQPEYLLRHRLPWITYDSVAYLTKNLGNNLNVFEFGSGGSTLFWSKYAAFCVSVEHDPLWYERVRYLLEPAGRTDYRLIHPEPAKEWADSGQPEFDLYSNPGLYLSSDVLYRGLSFQRYATQIDEFPAEFFDVVLVDGRARPSCLAHSVSKTKPGGMLILDNAEIPHYLAKTRESLRGFETISFRGVAPIGRSMTQTDIYIRLDGV